MENAKYTPGPWNVDGIEIEALVDPEESADYYAPICQLDTEWVDEVIVGNGRLIAAAPELLEACERIEGRLSADWQGDSLCLQHMVADALSIARAAIAKAKGERS